MTPAIPAIHLSQGFEPGQIERLKHAAFDVGFFYLDDHGIDADLLDAVFAQSKEFFRLPLEVKQSLSDKAMNRGYTAMGEQKLDPELQTKHGDTKEGFYIGRHITTADPLYDPSKFRGPNQWPAKNDLPQFQSTMEKYFSAMESVALRVVRMLAAALDVDRHYFDDSMQDLPIMTLRLLRYDPVKSDPDDGLFACGAHSDFGMITLLLTDDCPGLQIFDEKDGWIDVPPQPAKFVVNLGDMLERWTNGRCRSTQHRVLTNGSRERYSVPFFVEPSYDAVVRCLENCRGEEGPKWEPITAGEYLRQRFEDTHVEFERTPEPLAES